MGKSMKCFHKLQLTAVAVLSGIAVSAQAADALELSPALGTGYVSRPASAGTLGTTNNLPSGQQLGVNGTRLGTSAANNVVGIPLSVNDTVAPPAWAQGAYRNVTSLRLQPFASKLFQGRFAGTFSDAAGADYVLAAGDRVVIRIWGARTYDDVLVVDQQGNLFIPEVGPVHVGGLKHSQLPNAVKAALGRVFTDNVQVYVNLQSAQPVAVFVTGFVANPGRYAGGSMDSLMAFIDRAGGIDAERGSYRQIDVIRGGKTVLSCDLYQFALQGKVPQLRLKDGDVVLVKERGTAVAAYGLLREQAQYEFSTSVKADGSGLMSMAAPLKNVTHVSVSGTRNFAPFNKYLTVADFKKFELKDGDVVEFVADKRGETIMASVSGAITGASRFPVRKTVKLRELLRQVEVEPMLAATDAIYLRRQSVARDQKQIIQDSLRRLEQTALTATSSSPEEAKIRVEEAKLIQDFVKRASQVEPDGVIVVSRGGVVSDIWLEDGDEIVIPQKSNVVQVSGEVVMAKAVTYDARMSLDDYLAAVGGVSARADEKHILIAKQNGEIGLAEDLGIQAGDRILVLPKVDTKGMLLAKDLMQIIYQIAVATKIAVDL